MSDRLPFAAITMGDAAGIGPEIVVKALARYHPSTVRPVVMGQFEVFERAREISKMPVTMRRLDDADAGDYRPGVLNIVELPDAPAALVPFGKVSAASGKASVLSVRAAHDLSKVHPVKAILAAPLQKQAVTEAGFAYGDECELMSDLTGAPEPMMLLVSDKMRMATVPPLHVSLREACENLTADGIFRSIATLRENLTAMNISDPCIAVAALNPHGGEAGAMGDEEIRAIVPAIEKATARGWQVQGPYPADSLFFRASKGEFDCVLCMYHDQGRIAMKTMDFGHLVSAMIGVPVPYITVAHGTAYELAGTGKADAANFVDLLQFVDRIQ